MTMASFPRDGAPTPGTNAQTADLLKKVTEFSPAGKLGRQAVLFLLGFMAICAVVAPISGATVVSGTVVADGRTQILRHPQGGVLATINVMEGQKVESGDVVALLTGETQSANRDQLITRLMSDNVAIARLEAELAGSPFPWDVATRFPQYRPELLNQVIADQASTFASRLSYRQSELGVLNAQSSGLKERRIGLEGERAALQSQLDSLDDELTLRRAAQEQGYGRAAELRRLEREYAELQGSFSRAEGELRALQSELSETVERIAAFEDNQVQLIAEEIARLRTEEQEISNQLSAAEVEVDRVEIKASAPGVVNRLHINTIGGAIEPYSAIAEIVPEGAQPMLEARLSPNDIDSVAPGQTADVMFHSMSRHNEPPLLARVEFVSADSQIDDRTGAPFFVVRLSFDPSCFEGPNPAVLTPGMVAEVNIRQENYTFIQYLLQPITESLGRSFN